MRFIFEIILLVVFGILCIIVIKNAERREMSAVAKHSVLLKRYEGICESRDKLIYEKEMLQAEMKERDAQIDALSREVISESEERKQLLATMDELLRKNCDLTVLLEEAKLCEKQETK